MPTVFVTQQTDHNLSAAQSYGDFRFLNRTPLGEAVDALAAIGVMQGLLANFSDEDFLLCIGSPVLIGMACAVAARLNQGRYRLLVWDRNVRKYNSLNVDLGECCGTNAN